MAAASSSIPRIFDGGRLPFSPIDQNPPGSSSSSGQKPNTNKGDHDERILNSNDGDFESYLVDRQGNEYEPYSLAWRYLGMYIDCDIEEDYYGGYYDDFQRRLGGGDDDGNGNGCERLLLWAAYHDPRYRGGQIGEYKFYDFSTEEWDTSSCQTRRCARMDCHEPNTHFKLVGVFKEADGLVDWAEQLFKHEGYCIWDSDTYESMQSQYERWSTYCTQLYYSDSNGNTLYLDIKPEAEGNITMGIYLDEQCSQSSGLTFGDYVVIYYTSYYGDDEKGEEAAASWEELFDTWNENMNIYKICQPCRAYNLGKYSDEDDDESGSGSGDRRFLENGEGDEDEWGYNCYDDAGYTNVNQCYKFETKTDMEPAETDDLVRASTQGTILEIRVGNKVYGSGGFRSKPEPFSIGNGILAVVGLGVLAAVGFWLMKRFSDGPKIGALPASFQETLFEKKDQESPTGPSSTSGEKGRAKSGDNDELDPPPDSKTGRKMRPFLVQNTNDSLPNEKLAREASSKSRGAGGVGEDEHTDTSEKRAPTTTTETADNEDNNKNKSFGALACGIPDAIRSSMGLPRSDDDVSLRSSSS